MKGKNLEALNEKQNNEKTQRRMSLPIYLAAQDDGGEKIGYRRRKVKECS